MLRLMMLLCRGYLGFIKNNEVFDVWRAREEIVALGVDDVVFFKEQGDVAGLSDGVATEVDDARRRGVEQSRNDIGVEAGARWVDDDDFVGGDVVQGLFAGRYYGLGVFAELRDVAAHFTDGVFVDFD